MMFINKIHVKQPLARFTLYKHVNIFCKNKSTLLVTESYRCGPLVTNITNNAKYAVQIFQQWCFHKTLYR